MIVLFGETLNYVLNNVIDIIIGVTIVNKVSTWKKIYIYNNNTNLPRLNNRYFVLIYRNSVFFKFNSKILIKNKFVNHP